MLMGFSCCFYLPGGHGTAREDKENERSRDDRTVGGSSVYWVLRGHRDINLEVTTVELISNTRLAEGSSR